MAARPVREGRVDRPSVDQSQLCPRSERGARLPRRHRLAQHAGVLCGAEHRRAAPGVAPKDTAPRHSPRRANYSSKPCAEIIQINRDAGDARPYGWAQLCVCRARELCWLCDLAQQWPDQNPPTPPVSAAAAHPVMRPHTHRTHIRRARGKLWRLPS